MPYTLNGIGTRYAGRKNVSVLSGTCPFCGRQTSLSDYDTREFFCFLFVPLIPLHRFRIQSDCSSCRKHYRIPMDDFRATIESTVRPLQEAAGRAPGDPVAIGRLVDGLVSVRMFREAEEAARAGLAASPGNVPLNRAMGDLLAARGDHAAAEPLRRIVVGQEPRDARSRLALGRTLFVTGRFGDAAVELEEAARLDPSSADARLLLGEAHFSAGRWSSALQWFEELAVRHPEFATDRHILARRKECKEKLGLPVSPEERKAARRWWPFGRAGGRPAPAAIAKTNWKLVGIGTAVIVVVAVGGTLAVAFDNRDRPALYLVSGLSQTVTVKVDGESIPVGPGPIARRTIPPGRHRIVATGKGGEAVDSLDAEVPKQELLDALMEPRIYVYNVAASALLRFERIGYAEREADQKTTEEILSFQQFFGRPKVDYPFEAPPEKIKTKEAKVVFRTALNVARDLDYNRLGNLRFREGKKVEAEKCVRKAIQLAPCSVFPRRNIQSVLIATNRREMAVEEARLWIDACPGDRIEPHRAYQDLLESEGRQAALLEEYGKKLDANPGDAVSHYLYGRLLGTVEARLSEYDAALAIAPDLTRARTARGFALLSLERYSEAAAEMEKTFGARDREDLAVHAFADAAIGARDAERAARLLEARRSKEPESGSLEAACWRLILARQQWDVAERALRDKTRASDPETVWLRRAQLLGLTGRMSDLRAFLDPAKTPKEMAEAAANARFELQMTLGTYREAVEGLDREIASGMDPGPLYRLHQAAALFLAGDRRGGEARATAVASDTESPEWARSLAGGLVGSRKPADVLAKTRVGNFHLLPHAYFLLGVRAGTAGERAAANDFYRRGENACTDLEYPLLLLRRLAGT